VGGWRCPSGKECGHGEKRRGVGKEPASSIVNPPNLEKYTENSTRNSSEIFQKKLPTPDPLKRKKFFIG